MYLVICEGCWGVGKTETKARRTCQLIFGHKEMLNYLVYETDDPTVEVSRSGNILREKTSERLNIVRRVKNGVEVEKKETPKVEEVKATETKVTVVEEVKIEKEKEEEIISPMQYGMGFY